MMNHRLPSLFALMIGCAGALCVALATPAAAQQQACVMLQVGSGYVAQMSIRFGSATVGPSPNFAIGQTQCLTLAQVPDGMPFTVRVRAILGETVSCAPNIVRVANFQGNVTFFASGTTLNVHCFLPASSPESQEGIGIVHEENL
jgi:hypothetical protein